MGIHTFERAERRVEKKVRDVNYLKSLLLHRRIKNTTSDLLIGRIQDFAHEAKHCYQFEMGFHSFNSEGYSGLLYDYTDEVEAHYRGFLFWTDNEKK